MTRPGWKRGLVCLCLLVVCASGVLFLICWRYRFHSYHDYNVYRTVSKDYTLGDDLWFGRIRAGQNVEAVVANGSAHRTMQYGQFRVFEYFPGGPPLSKSIPMERLQIITKDDTLVEAAVFECRWGKVFFKMNEADYAEYRAEVDRRLKAWEQEQNAQAQ